MDRFKFQEIDTIISDLLSNKIGFFDLAKIGRRRAAELIRSSRIFIIPASFSDTPDDFVPKSKFFDAPFSTCFFEFDEIISTKVRTFSNWEKRLINDPDRIINANIEFIIANEISPVLFEVLILLSDPRKGGPRVLHSATLNFDFDRSSASSYLYVLIENMNKKEYILGGKRVSYLAKTPMGRQTKIKDIILIKSKSLKKVESSVERRLGPFDFSHRFEVRGHWRKCDRIGKDRSGEYCVKGFTWVSDHIRGPEDKPLIVKKRVHENVRFTSSAP